jgi:hypothetical protein
MWALEVDNLLSDFIFFQILEFTIPLFNVSTIAELWVIDIRFHRFLKFVVATVFRMVDLVVL